MNNELWNARGSTFGPQLVGGFAATTVVGTTWVITHLPWMGLQGQVSTAIIVACWLITLAAFASRVRKSRSIAVGLGAGLISGLAGLVFFGSRLGKPADVAGLAPGVVPNAALLALGFIGLSLGLGLIAGVIGRVIARAHTAEQTGAHWLARFALVTCVAIMPLIFIGGLVTSTASGMAVPDWPQTYGTNMFLYPLAGHVGVVDGKPYAQVFVEHTHRLFGAFVGLSTLILLVWTCLSETRRWVKILAAIAFSCVVIQGLLGGARVLENSTLGAMVHGILAQLTFGVVVALATVLSDSYRMLTPTQRLVEPAFGKRVKFLGTLTMHSLIVQLILGAWYRHFNVKHVLFTHIGFSLVVLFAAIIAGFTLSGEKARQHVAGRTVGRLGLALAIVTTFQFLLGWVALAYRGATLDPTSVPEALVRTAHQANGGLLLAFAAAVFIWSRRLAKGSSTPESAIPATN